MLRNSRQEPELRFKPDLRCYLISEDDLFLLINRVAQFFIVNIANIQSWRGYIVSQVVVRTENSIVCHTSRAESSPEHPLMSILRVLFYYYCCLNIITVAETPLAVVEQCEL